MRLFPNDPALESALWIFMCIFTVMLFYGAVILIVLLVRQKRYRLLGVGIFLVGLSFLAEMSFNAYLCSHTYSKRVVDIKGFFDFLPDWALILTLVVLTVTEACLFYNTHRYEKTRITAMSVKEATDSLPIGICWYAPGGLVLLANHAMERFCERTIGGPLLSGETLWNRLCAGDLLPGCQTIIVGNEQVVLFSDNSAYKLRNETVRDGKRTNCMLLVLDISEAYRKTLELQQKQEKLTLLGKRLDKVNSEIVALTVEREILNARVQMHDELGSNLLSIKRFILNGGTEKEKAVLLESLGHNLAFLKTARPAPVRDEYDLMLDTAKRLGVSVTVTGELPQTMPHKHIIATAIHECFTNTIRHAHGDELRVTITQEDERIAAVFENNGEPPRGEIFEKGGLISLRALTEQSGGRMRVRTEPAFAIILDLPKEVDHAL